MTTRAERAEALAVRRAMKAKYPACRHCKRPVCCGQTDAYGVPCHLMCAQAFDALPPSHPGRRWAGPPQEGIT